MLTVTTRPGYLCAFALPLILVSCTKGDWHPETPALQDSKLVVEVFSSPSDSEQGYSAIREAANAAMDTADFKSASNYITLEFRNDPDSPEEAARTAQKTSLNPDVLAVIGHSL